MSWFGKSKKQQAEESEWIAGLPETVEDDPRLGLPATSHRGFSGTIVNVSRCKDGQELFEIADNTGGANGGLSPDQITIHKGGQCH